MIAKRSALIVAFLLACGLCQSASFGDSSDADGLRFSVPWIGVKVEPRDIVCQGTDDMGCTYASILNALKFGDGKESKIAATLPGKNSQEWIKHLRGKYGCKPSRFYGKGSRNREDRGVTNVDTLDTYNDLRKENGLPMLWGSTLQRDRHETSTQQLQRIHAILLVSLKQHELPLVGLTNEIASWEGSWWNRLEPEPLDNGCKWNVLNRHVVVVCGITEATNPDGSFSLRCIDSLDGKVRELHIYAERRNFGAYEGPGKRSKFLHNRPFLAVSGDASFLPNTHIWSERTVSYLEYAMFRPKEPAGGLRL